MTAVKFMAITLTWVVLLQLKGVSSFPNKSAYTEAGHARPARDVAVNPKHCRAGFEWVDKAIATFCLPCPPGTWQSEYESKLLCKPKLTCSAGSYFVDNPTVEASCEACPANTEQPLSNHMKESCDARQTCPPGSTMGWPDATLVSNLGGCSGCQKSFANGLHYFCEDEPWYLENLNTTCDRVGCAFEPQKVTPALCQFYCNMDEKCEYFTTGPEGACDLHLVDYCQIYEIETSERTLYRTASAPGCTSCDALTYQPNHGTDWCKLQPGCGQNTFFVDSQTALRECVPCSEGTYQPAPSHFLTECIPDTTTTATTVTSTTKTATYTSTTTATVTETTATSTTTIPLPLCECKTGILSGGCINAAGRCIGYTTGICPDTYTPCLWTTTTTATATSATATTSTATATSTSTVANSIDDCNNGALSNFDEPKLMTKGTSNILSNLQDVESAEACASHCNVAGKACESFHYKTLNKRCTLYDSVGELAGFFAKNTVSFYVRGKTCRTTTSTSTTTSISTSTSTHTTNATATTGTTSTATTPTDPATTTFATFTAGTGTRTTITGRTAGTARTIPPAPPVTGTGTSPTIPATAVTATASTTKPTTTSNASDSVTVVVAETTISGRSASSLPTVISSTAILTTTMTMTITATDTDPNVRASVTAIHLMFVVVAAIGIMICAFMFVCRRRRATRMWILEGVEGNARNENGRRNTKMLCSLEMSNGSWKSNDEVKRNNFGTSRSSFGNAWSPTYDSMVAGRESASAFPFRDVEYIDIDNTMPQVESCMVAETSLNQTLSCPPAGMGMAHSNGPASVEYRSRHLLNTSYGTYVDPDGMRAAPKVAVADELHVRGGDRRPTVRATLQGHLHVPTLGANDENRGDTLATRRESRLSVMSL